MTTITNAYFGYFRGNDYARTADTLGRWNTHAPPLAVLSTDNLSLGGWHAYHTYYTPGLVANLRLDKFRATYALGKYAGPGNPYWGEFDFHVQDLDHGKELWALHTTQTAAAPTLGQMQDGNRGRCASNWWRVVDERAIR